MKNLSPLSRIARLAAFGCLLSASTYANPEVEKKIHALLDDPKSVYVSLDTPSFMSLGWDLPDGGKAVTALALAAPGGAFDPRDLEKIPAKSLGYEAKWCVERYKPGATMW